MNDNDEIILKVSGTMFNALYQIDKSIIEYVKKVIKPSDCNYRDDANWREAYSKLKKIEKHLQETNEIKLKNTKL